MGATLTDRSGAGRRRRLLAAGLLLLLLELSLGGGAPTGIGRAQEAGTVQPLAQGVGLVPDGEVVWRAVRARAEPVTATAFAPRALGFVVAANDPVLVADAAISHVTLLAPGEAVFVPPGESQQRSSVTDATVTYLGVELVAAADAGAASDDATVFEPGQPFPSPGGYRDFDLLGGAITSDDSLLVPDTGQKNIILVTNGALAVNKPGTEATTLIAGESATFSGDLELAGGSDDPSTFVVAIIGDEVTVPAPIAAPPAPSPAGNAAVSDAPLAPTAPGTIRGGGTPVPETGTTDTVSGGGGGSGSITVQALVCPPGMTAERLLPDQCTPATSPFEVTLAGDALSTPLILADATADGESYTWGDLPFGTYRLAQVLPPAGSTEYTIGGASAVGDPIAGYTIELTDAAPDLTITFYNFVAAE